MRVVQLISDTDRRGAQSFAVGLAAALGARGFDIDTRALVPGGAKGGVGVEPLTSRPHWASALAGVKRLARQADVVIAHGSTTLPAVALGGGSTPFVYRSIGDLPQWAVTRRQRATTSWALRRAAAVTVLWDDVGTALVRDFGVAGAKVHVVPNAADASVFTPGESPSLASTGLAPPVLAYVGALTEEKRVEDILTVAADRPQLQVVIAGDGPLRNKLERQSSDNVEFLGSVTHPVDLYRRCDLVVLASRTEGQPGVLIEAGLCAKPVVATNVGGVSAVVLDGETGALVPVGDTRQLASAIDLVLANAEALGAAALDHCRATFSFEVVADRWADLLRHVQAGT